MIWKALVAAAADVAFRVGKLALARKLIEDAKKEMEKKGKKVGVLIFIALTLQSCALYTRTSPCDKLRVAESLSCSTDPESSECIEAKDLLKKQCTPKE